MSNPKSNEEGKNAFLEGVKGLPTLVSAYLADVLDLKKGVNADQVIAEIAEKKSLAGANAWMLMCSIVIASIGLSQNSQAVIIGAMLISPLMSPILGIGMSVGINDMDTLRSSLGHFVTAIIIALLSSYIYFAITPINELTSEILARTRPTFLDIFVAIFGGLAGIISVARKDISTTLPGVAIATALMPPLCVTGYGLATDNFEIAYRSFYLFFLNSFFVALSTYAIVRLLRFPYHQYPSQKAWRKNMILMIGFSAALAIPSFKIFQGVLRDFRLERNFTQFVTDCLNEDEIYLDSKTIDKENGIIYLKVYGNRISLSKKEEYINCLQRCGVKDYDLKIISSSDVRLNDVKVLEQNLEQISSQIEQNKIARQEADEQVKYYQGVHIDSVQFLEIQREVSALYPQLESFGLSRMHLSVNDTVRYDYPVAIAKWKNQRNAKEQITQLEKYLEARLKLEDVEVVAR